MLQVVTFAEDLQGKTETDFDKWLTLVLKEQNVAPTDFEQAIIIHNAASMGDISKNLSQIGGSKEVSDYFNLNLTSFVVLNSVFLHHFPASQVKNRMVVNISSICALQPFKSWSLYCAGEKMIFLSVVYCNHTFSLHRSNI